MKQYTEETIFKKRDEKGRIYREVRCPGEKEDGSLCRAWICDEYIRHGRIRVKCFRCGKIWVMVFRQRSSGDKPNKKKG